METRRERRRHQRERPAGGRIPVRHRANGGAWQDGEALDIGAGGTFLVEAAWPVGTAVELTIDIAEAEGALILPGVVRWTSGDGSDDEADAHPVVSGLAGVGVQFVGLDLDVVQVLQAHLASLAPAAGAAGADIGAGAGAGARDGGASADDDDDADVPATD